MANEKKDDVKSEKEKSPSLPGGPCCFCHVEKDIKEKDVDKMIDYAHENLQEMGKALESLDRSCEQDVKLMIADLVSRIKHWWDILRKNENSARQIEEMQSEIDRLRAKLQKCETGESSQRLYLKEDEYVPSEEESVEELVEKSEGFKEEWEDSSLIPVPKSEKVPKSAEESWEVSKLAEESWEVSKLAEESWEVSKSSEEFAGEGAIFLSGEEEISMPSEAEDAIVQTTDNRADAAVQSQPDKDKTKHEIDLETKLAQLRKENEKIMQCQDSYCEAVQRALLRGVASLNVEALKVLRCPPIPCCTPYPPGSATLHETSVPCGTKTPRDSLSKRKTGCRRAIQRNGNNFRTENDKSGCQHGCCPLKPCGSPCCPFKKHRKSRDEGLVFLLHQDDAANLSVCNNPTMPQLCGASLLKRIEIPPFPKFCNKR